MEELKQPESQPASKAQAEKDAEFQKRIQDFNAELIPLLKKYHLGVGASAFLTPDGRVAAGPRLYDDTVPVKDDAAPAATTAAPSKPASKLSEG